MKSYDVLVIGVGGWGSAALYHLAKRGLRVCGIEQFSLGHDRGSSHGESRVIRMAYFMHPDYVPVLRRAYELWRELETAAGESLMTLPGLLCIGEPDGPFIRGLETCYATHDLPHERWTAAQAMTRFPQFHLPEDAACYWDPLGGYLRADACVRAHARLAQQHGADILENEEVIAIEDDGCGVTVRTKGQTLRAAKVIHTTGAFARDLTTELGQVVAAQRKVLFWYETSDPAAFGAERFPVWIAKIGGLNYYGFPSTDGLTIKAAEDTGGEVLDDARIATTTIRPDDETNLGPFLQNLFGAKLGARRAHKTCLYENTPDRNFIVDMHPQNPNVILAVGGSGHGFKFCSVIGEMAADLAESGRSSLRPDIFALGNRAQPVIAN